MIIIFFLYINIYIIPHSTQAVKCREKKEKKNAVKQSDESR